MLNTHGSNYLESLFGAKARNNLELMGGVQNVAIVLSGIFLSLYKHLNKKYQILESHTIDDFARALHLNPQDVRNLKMIFISVEQGDLGILSAIGIKVIL